MYPCVEIKLSGILHNLNILKTACNSRGISLALVTKVLGGNLSLVQEIVKQGQIDTICDSRVQNLKAFKDLPVEKWLIRSPMICQADDVVQYADVSLNSELSVLQALDLAAYNHRKTHKVILMYEGGDLREGCYYDELSQLITECDRLSNIEVLGIGINLSCLNDTVPNEHNMSDFISAVDCLEAHHGKKFPVISGGASSSAHMLFTQGLPQRINNLRMGEAVFLGNIPVYDQPFPGAKEDNFILKAQIIELKKKPSSPNHTPDSDTDLMYRAIVALGKQDIYLPGLSCVDDRIRMIGGSSDHVILDVTGCCDDYAVGSIVEFKMNYNCLLNAMTSNYIEKYVTLSQ